ncbi:MAG: 4-hydroxyacetophenone monooxygenase [Frankiales bacterium]|jgi:4-hydroxyacetophenone monooxygenase|nr:4-hydroxyacetophenone monooxygenase [Frankiales bacterium]
MNDERAKTTLAEHDVKQLRDAVAVANVPTLLMVLVQLTGELSWLAEDYRPTRARGLEDNDTGGLADEVQEQIRDAAFEAILAWREGQPPALLDASDELIIEMMTICMGEVVPLDYAPIIKEEIELAHRRAVGQAPAPGHRFDTPRHIGEHGGHGPDMPPAAMTALIIGAGVSGLGAAAHLDQVGIAYTIVDKGENVGGVWQENRYPGCGVDTPSHLYTFSFAPNDWKHYFALRDEIAAYIEGLADDFGIRPRIRFRTEALSADYSEETQRWTVQLRTPDGAIEEVSADLLITAVGAFNKPKMPNVKGAEKFKGAAAHTARWPKEEIELAGKRVAVIGNGASAMQVVPEIAKTVEKLFVFTRSSQWAVPFEKFRKEIPQGVRYLLDTVPYYYAWYRLRLGWAYNDKIHPSLQKDPTWPHPERSLNSINDGHRQFFTRHIVHELGDRQDLLDDVLPTYPPYGKRILLDNGWFRTLAMPHVELINTGVKEITEKGLIAGDGREIEVDVIIYATGFDVVHFLAPMEVRGRAGQALHDVWDGDDARAYLGAMVPGFPNFFCLYGPNTQFGHGGSLITVLERQIQYVMDVIDYMRVARLGAIEVKEEVFTNYNERVDAAHENMVWTHPGMDTYYRNSKGRVVVNNPFKIVDYWHMTRNMDSTEFVTEPDVRAAAPTS